MEWFFDLIPWKTIGASIGILLILSLIVAGMRHRPTLTLRVMIDLTIITLVLALILMCVRFVGARLEIVSGWMRTVGFVGLFAILCVSLISSYFKVKSNYFAVMNTLGFRTGRVCFEGPHFRIPFIERERAFSFEPVPKKIVVSFTTRDKVSLVCSIVLRFRPDPNVKQGRRVIFSEISEDDIVQGVQAEVKAKLGALGGTYESDLFIKDRRALSDMLNMFLRMGIPYHLRHRDCGIPGCLYPEQVEADNLIEFYNKHWRVIKPELDEESSHPDERSTVEMRFGIDVINLSLEDVDFSEETKQAMEEGRQVSERAKVTNDYVALASKLKGAFPDAPAQLIINEAGRLLDPSVKKEVISFEGEAGSLVGGLMGRGGR